MNAHALRGTFRRVSLRPSGVVESGTSKLFGRIRLRLTLSYTAAMLATLLLLGGVLYTAMSHTLLDPVQGTLQADARSYAGYWSSVSVVAPECPNIPGPGLWACFGPSGQVVESREADDIQNFADPALATAALHSGSASAVVDLGRPFGAMQMYAISVQGQGGGVLGVIQVGEPVGQYLHALQVLVLVLAGLGILVLILAAVGGLILADRALLPARVANQRQRDFIADASHELRTPLTLLRADAEVLLRGSRHRLPEDDVALLEDMVQETSHMSALATSMLDLARLDSEDVHLEQEVIDLSDVAGSAARRAAARASEGGIAVETDLAAGTMVIGDRLLLDQAVLALLDNAIKYNHPGGTVTLRTWSTGREAHLAVQDTGEGIPEEHLQRLSERFYRVDKARSRAMGGAGLGLAIVQRIAHLHGGSLGIQSADGGGTTVVLTLPRRS